MLKAHSILNDIQRGDGRVRNPEDWNVRLHLGTICYLKAIQSETDEGQVWDETTEEEAEAADIFIDMMARADPMLYEQIRHNVLIATS